MRNVLFLQRALNTLVKQLAGGNFGIDPALTVFQQGAVMQLDEATLNQLAENGALANGVAVMLDADGGLITQSTTLGFSSPNRMQVSGSPTITIPPADAAHNGFKFVFKNVGTGTVTLEAETGDIDGAATLVSNTQNEVVALQIINGVWNRV
jgi:hypothetical protein